MPATQESPDAQWMPGCSHAPHEGWADEIACLRKQLLAATGEVDRLSAQVAAVEKVRDKYKANMKKYASSMTLSYCDPYAVNRTAVRDLDNALAGGVNQ